MQQLEEYNPFYEEEDEDLSYLELKNIPEISYNPLLNYPIDRPPDPVDEIMGVLTDTNYLHFACKVLLNIELLPFQLVILDTLWRRRLPMLIASRGASKSFILSVYALLRMVFHPGCKIVIVGSAFRQSKQLHDYMTTIWEKAPILREIAGRGSGPRRGVDRCDFSIGDSITYAIPLGTGEKIRGLRANYIISDEFASISENIFNLVIQGFGVVAASPVDKVKQAALVNRLKELGAWTDVMEQKRLLDVTGNQIVYSGTCSYSFNHFYRYFKKWHSIISSKGDMDKIKDLFGENEDSLEGFNWKDYAIMRIPYTHLPQGFLDPGILAQARATLHHSQFLMEYCAIYAADSDGFYKRSIIEAATTNDAILVPSGLSVQFSAIRQGDKDRAYVIAIDPAAEVDNAAIVILEMHTDHRRIVNCWTTNRKKYNQYKKLMKESGVEINDDYYRYIAKRVRYFMRMFNIERIMMDKNGGGVAIQEALGIKDTCEKDELPVFLTINPDEPKQTDMENGIHMLELVTPTSEFNSEANHGMLKDLQDKILLFPMFDSIEMEKALQLDVANSLKFDTYEDLVQEIEELKAEMTTIVVTPSSTLGRETFDTPQIKTEGGKKGRLRKDRFSALLYANYYARNRNKQDAFHIVYKAVGGTKDTMKVRGNQSTSMYRGPGILKFANSNWLKGNQKQLVFKKNR